MTFGGYLQGLVLVVSFVVFFGHVCELKEIGEDPSNKDELCSQGRIMASELVHVDFEVYGRVQGVFFRKYTQDQGSKLGLRGFCRNTGAGTVSGTMEGPRQAVDQMKYWLEHTGSPSSRISKVEFKNEKVIDSYSFPGVFDIARTV